ncbi:DUF6642 family protein [Rhodococcus ruber]|uniref:DUF6642 family protein n=1 Tax=Rhodococcus ruber TaxID=1830 RepID=UPI000F546C1A|nr:DUF6642 family protein [Rhodococcus ruber]
MTAKKPPPGVLCLEGEWTPSIGARLSIEPALRLVEFNSIVRVAHRDVATRAELEYYLDKWLGKGNGTAGYDLCYFGFHGSCETILLGQDEMSLDQLAELLAGRCVGKVLYFAACKVLAAPGEHLKSFCKKTGAKAIVGYTRDVDWFEAAALELLLITQLVRSVSMKPAYTKIKKKYPDLARRLGFRMAHSTWASDRSVAKSAIE